MKTPDYFWLKIAAFNAAGLCLTVGGPTVIDAHQTSGISGLGPRHYPLGLAICWAAPLVFALSAVTASVRLPAKFRAVWPSVVLAAAGLLSLLNFGLHTAIIIWMLFFGVASLVASGIHYYLIPKQRIAGAMVDPEAKRDRVKEHITFWRTIAVTFTFGYLAMLVPLVSFIWTDAARLATKPSEANEIALFGAAEVVLLSLYVGAGPIWEAFKKAHSAADMLLEAMDTLPARQGAVAPDGHGPLGPAAGEPMTEKKQGDLSAHEQTEIQVHLKEYEKLRDEVLHRVSDGHRILVLSLGSAALALPLLLGHAADIAPPMTAGLLYLLTVLYAALAMEFVASNFYIGLISTYLHRRIEPSVNRIFGSSEHHQLLYWETFLRERRGTALGGFLAEGESAAVALILLLPGAICLAAAHYLVSAPLVQPAQAPPIVQSLSQLMPPLSFLAYAAYVVAMASLLLGAVYNVIRADWWRPR